MKPSMKPLVIAATALALISPAYAQTNAAQAAQDAATAAETAADQAQDAAGDAADQTGAAAEQAADQAADAADKAADEAATAADNAASATSDMGEAAADEAANAADSAESAASDAADSAADAMAEEPIVVPDVNAPEISEADPGQLGSWITSRRIWTTNQPSSTEWVDPSLEQRPAEWQDIAKVNDVVLDDSGTQVVGYIADIGGFLGIGAKKVLLGVDAIHLVTVGNDTFFATNYTKQELQALPDFDEKTVRK